MARLIERISFVDRHRGFHLNGSMRTRIKLLLLLIPLLMEIGCSSFSFREGYRLDDQSQKIPVTDSCKSPDDQYRGAVIKSDDGEIEINFVSRSRSDFVGPVLLPILPIGFGEAKILEIFVSPKIDSTNLLHTDVSQWQLSINGKEWFSAREVELPDLYGKGSRVPPGPLSLKPSPEYHAPNSIGLIFPVQMKDAETLYFKTSAIIYGSKKISPVDLKWRRQKYSKYTPLWGFPHTGPDIRMRCGDIK